MNCVPWSTALAHRHGASFAALTETWLTSDTLNCERDIPNYALFRHDRHPPLRNGGVALYVSTKYTSRELSLLDPADVSLWSSTLGLEVLTVLCSNHVTSLLVCVLYRSPCYDNHAAVSAVLRV